MQAHPSTSSTNTSAGSAWKWEERSDPKTGEVKLTKPPHSRNGLPVSVKNPAHWMSKAEAASVPNMHGIGFSLFQHPNLAALDLDHCRERETGEITNWARQIVEMAGSYTEITPSGEGLRVIGVVPEGTHEAQFIVPMDPADPAQKVEVYVHPARYITMSGEMWEELPTAHKALNDISVVLEHMKALKLRAAGEKNSEGSEAPDPDLTALPPWLRALIRDGAPKGERSEALFKVVANLRRLGFAAEQISQILRHHKTGIGAKCFESGKDDTERHVILALRKIDDEIAKERAKGKGNPPPPEDAEEPIAFLNANYCVVEEGGKVRVLTFKDIDIGRGRQRSMAVYLSFDDFANLYGNQRVFWKDKDGKEKSAALGRYWLNHPGRRTYMAVVFRPNEPPRSAIASTFWRGWGVEPVKDAGRSCSAISAKSSPTATRSPKHISAAGSPGACRTPTSRPKSHSSSAVDAAPARERSATPWVASSGSMPFISRPRRNSRDGSTLTSAIARSCSPTKPIGPATRPPKEI